MILLWLNLLSFNAHANERAFGWLAWKANPNVQIFSWCAVEQNGFCIGYHLYSTVDGSTEHATEINPGKIYIPLNQAYPKRFRQELMKAYQEVYKNLYQPRGRRLKVDGSTGSLQANHWMRRLLGKGDFRLTSKITLSVLSELLACENPKYDDGNCPKTRLRF